jgi:hypothetical protein
VHGACNSTACGKQRRQLSTATAKPYSTNATCASCMPPTCGVMRCMQTAAGLQEFAVESRFALTDTPAHVAAITPGNDAGKQAHPAAALLVVMCVMFSQATCIHQHVCKHPAAAGTAAIPPSSVSWQPAHPTRNPTNAGPVALLLASCCEAGSNNLFTIHKRDCPLCGAYTHALPSA